MKKLSAYTIASNCSDMQDLKDGIQEIQERISQRLSYNIKIPAYYYYRLDKLIKAKDKINRSK